MIRPAPFEDLLVRHAAPPYAALAPLPPGDAPLPRGALLVVEADAAADANLAQVVASLRERFPAAPVVVRVPALTTAAIRLAQSAHRLRVRAVVSAAEPLADALRPILTRPDDLGDDVVEWLALRGCHPHPAAAALVRRIVRDAHRAVQLGALLAEVGESERTARHRFRSRGLPPPSAWHQLGRALHAALRVQAEPRAGLTELALSLGFSDHSGFSRQLTRAFGVTPAGVRGTLGWEWLLQRWWARGPGRDSSGNNLPVRTLSQIVSSARFSMHAGSRAA